ncbi:MAG TPA: biotin/lipoyl-containing protein, partial [Steroidobacteraceae bacterium]
MAVTEVRVPDLGGFKDVAVIDVLVRPGETIAVESPLVTLESDKAAMDVPSTVAGVVEKVHIVKGGKVSAGDLVATIKTEAAVQAAQPASAPAAAPAPAAPAVAPAVPPPAAASTAPAVAVSGARTDLAPIDEPGFSRAHAGPSVRRFARELGVDLARVAGHGFKGRITHEDIKAFVKSALAGAAAAPAAAGGGAPALPATPVVDVAQFGPVETQPLSRIQRISGPRLHASWVNIPHVTQFDEADITELEAFR